MTSILVNAVSIREGGPLVVLRHLIAAMAEAEPGWRWIIAAPDATAAQLEQGPSTEVRGVPDAVTRGWRVRWWYEAGLPRLVRDTSADAVFSHTNYLPARPLPCPSLLLVQHAGHFSQRFAQAEDAAQDSATGRLAWQLKRRWVRASIRAATQVTVQSHALAQAIAADMALDPSRIDVVAHGTGQLPVAVSPVAPWARGGAFRVGYICKPGVQKNFGVVFRAVSRLIATGIDTRLVLTLDPRDKSFRSVMDEAATCGVEEAIENHGAMDPAGIVGLYRSLHAFAFASWCESWGFPMAEAMAGGLPLFVADVPSNREVAASGALAFPPDDDTALAGLLRLAATDRSWHEVRAAAALARARELSWTSAGAGTLASLKRIIGARAHG